MSKQSENTKKGFNIPDIVNNDKHPFQKYIELCFNPDDNHQYFDKPLPERFEIIYKLFKDKFIKFLPIDYHFNIEMSTEARIHIHGFIDARNTYFVLDAINKIGNNQRARTLINSKIMNIAKYNIKNKEHFHERILYITKDKDKLHKLIESPYIYRQNSIIHKYVLSFLKAHKSQ